MRQHYWITFQLLIMHLLMACRRAHAAPAMQGGFDVLPYSTIVSDIVQPSAAVEHLNMPGVNQGELNEPAVLGDLPGTVVTVTSNVSWFTPGTARNASCHWVIPVYLGNSGAKQGHCIGGAIITPATVLSASKLTCSAPMISGYGTMTASLAISMHTCVGTYPTSPASGPVAGRPQPFRCQEASERTSRSCLGGNISSSVRVAILPALDFAVARRPYIGEHEGSVIVKLSKLLKPGMLLSARLRHAGTPLFTNVTQSPGTTAAIPFDLSTMPGSVTDRILLTVTYAVVRGSTTEVTKSKIFLRVPEPPAKYTGSVWQLDHEHRSVLKNGWQQFIGVGWFNTPFNENYYQGGACICVCT
eukprot:COSAG02_NODE_1325_length_13237_cov_5.436901_14_plen_358_part_00